MGVIFSLVVVRAIFGKVRGPEPFLACHAIRLIQINELFLKRREQLVTVVDRPTGSIAF
jgi:hypothetical protein